MPAGKSESAPLIRGHTIHDYSMSTESGRSLNANDCHIMAHVEFGVDFQTICTACTDCA